MKRIKVIVTSLFAYSVLYGQQSPTGNPPSPPTVNNNANSAWYRGGNNPIGTSPLATNNIFGTRWNSPIYTITGNANRSRLNGSISYAINSLPVQPRDGYMLLGANGLGLLGRTLYGTPDYGAFSLLHLNGGGNLQEGGYRNWMRTGVTFTSNNDLAYIGHRQNGTGSDITDMVVAWSDNANSPFPGPDNLVFNFTSGNGTSGNDLNGDALNGREIMRLTGTGNIGMGPRFSNSNQPQSDLHLNTEDNTESWFQITNQLGTGQTFNDGLRIGYNQTSTNNKEAVINQRENDRLSLYSNNGERIRITQIDALNGGINFNPAGALTNNATRIGISHNPGAPITRPLSLLHLGYNTQSATATNNDGWRPWMDVGMFTSNGSDNVYIGLKNENGILNDRQDAVLSWGDNQASGLPPGNGPDNFRFIFTSTTAVTSPNTSPANTADGLEGGRMTPTLTTGVFTGFGGSPGVNPYAAGSDNPTATLEVNSWGQTTDAGGSSGLRFTNLNNSSPTMTNPGLGVLSVDADGDVIYVPSLNNSSQPGNYCGTTINSLTGNYEMPLAGSPGSFNYYYTGQGETVTNVSIGLPCNTPLLFQKFEVYQATANDMFNPGISIAGQFDNVANGAIAIGVMANANSIANSEIGGYFSATNGSNNTGIYCESSPIGTAGATNNNWAAYANGAVYYATAYTPSDSLLKKDIEPISNALEIVRKLNPIKFNYDIEAADDKGLNLPNSVQYGFKAQDVENILPELVTGVRNLEKYDEQGLEIKAAYNFKAINYNGFIGINTKAIQELSKNIDKSTLSDQSIKINVQNLTGALAKVKQMRGVNYNWSPSAQNSMDLDNLRHIGFIAQEINAIDPLLTFVDDSSLMHVNYDRVVPMLVESIKELDGQLQQKDSILHAMQDQINQILNNMEACCNDNHQMQSNTVTGLKIELKDAQSVVLEQNVPNPFAEQTTINYYLTDDVAKAQILFYNAQGKLIQSTELTQKGKGQLNVFASDLSNGIYTYTLVVDGKIIETKKMVKQQ